ncbi:MAG: conjugal transfer protein TraX [Treponema sp.]|jgi:hypothetical protein|nr:conjugal transfer protein TraX [Treponema sp.]
METTETEIPPFKGLERPGLSGSSIKSIGLVLMTLDHIHQMFIAHGAPEWLSWFGRPVALMFVFLCAEGFYYTRNKARYLLQMLAGFLFMSVMNQVLSFLMPLEEVALINNIFSTLLLAAFYMGAVDLFRQGIREKKTSAITLALGGMFLPLLIGAAFLAALATENRTAFMVLVFFPNPVTAEGGIIMVFMGLLFYLLRKYRFAQAGAVLVISAVSWFRREPGSLDFQWLMVLAVIPMILYNGKRGSGNKYFFYIFYPAHIYLLYLTAWLIR